MSILSNGIERIVHQPIAPAKAAAAPALHKAGSPPIRRVPAEPRRRKKKPQAEPTVKSARAWEGEREFYEHPHAGGLLSKPQAGPAPRDDQAWEGEREFYSSPAAPPRGHCFNSVDPVGQQNLLMMLECTLLPCWESLAHTTGSTVPPGSARPRVATPIERRHRVVPGPFRRGPRIAGLGRKTTVHQFNL